MKIFIVLSNLFKSSLNRTGSFIFQLILPISCVIIPLLIFNNTGINKVNVNMAIVDEDKSQIANDLQSLLKDKYGFNVYMISKTEADQYLIADKVSSILLIPKNFESNTLKKYSPSVELFYLKENEETNTIKEIINNYIVNLNILVSSDSYIETSINSTSSVSLHNINKVNEENNILESSLRFITLLVIILVNLSFSGFLIDKNNGNLNRVLTTGLNPSHYMVGYIIWNIFICFLQGLLLLGLLYILRINLGISTGNLIILLVLISLIAISFSVFSISYCKNEAEITLLNALIVFPTCMLSGCLWPVEIMTVFFQKLSLVFPQRHIFIIMKNFQAQNNLPTTVIEILLILLLCTLFCVLGFIKINSKGWKRSI